jgi:hypothetical protein
VRRWPLAVALLLCVFSAWTLTPVSFERDSTALTETVLSTQQAPVPVISEVIAGLAPNVTDAQCHQRWHVAGAKLGAAGYSLLEVSKVPDFDGCNWGLVHGFVEGALDSATRESLTADVERACAPAASINREVYGNCRHGIGHAVWRISVPDIAEALVLCATLGENGPDCSDGVFMSFSESASRKDPAVLAVAWGVCAGVQDVMFQSKCYRYAGYMWWELAQGDTAKMLANCPEGPSECGLGVGRAIGTHRQSAAAAITACAAASGEVRKGCARGVGEWFALLRNTQQADGDPSLVCEEIGAALYEEFGKDCEIGELQQ